MLYLESLIINSLFYEFVNVAYAAERPWDFAPRVKSWLQSLLMTELLWDCSVCIKMRMTATQSYLEP